MKEVALKASDICVRRVAVEKITDESFLKEVALKDANSFVREAAVEKITDEAALKEVALKAVERKVRKAAVNKITDQKFRQKILDKIKQEEEARKQEAKLQVQGLLIESVRQLIGLYQTHPDGFYANSYAAEPVKVIGKKLNEAGGFELMLEAHGMFVANYPVYGMARNLEMVWHGIGSWQG